MTDRVIGIIGGSGLYRIDGLSDVAWRRVESPFGRTSDEFCFGTLDGQPVVFLPRHGRGHVLPPSAINFRANIDALKRCGVTDIVSLSAVGSLREDFAPGDFVVIDQFIDRTFAREKSFFGPGCVAHVSMAHPVCGRIGDALAAAAPTAGIAGEARRHLYRHGRSAILDPRRERALPLLGLRRDRDDQHAGGQARPRGRDLLRDRRDGHRLRLLASRPRRRDGRDDPVGARRQCRARPSAGARGRAAAGAAPFRAMPPGMRPRARQCADHRARQPRPGAAGPARRGGRDGFCSGNEARTERSRSALGGCLSSFPFARRTPRCEELGCRSIPGGWRGICRIRCCRTGGRLPSGDRGRYTP